MATYKKTNVTLYPRIKEKVTTDNLYWKNFEFPITRKEQFAVTHIEFNPVKPHQYALTYSTKVRLYDCYNDKMVRNLSKFKSTAYSGSFRPDGTLLVAGGEEGRVRVFNYEWKSMLRVLDGHKRGVHVTKFTSDGRHVMSGSDDCTVRVWDLAAATQVITYSEHKDYVRCGAVCAASRDLILSGSYDHTVRMYDVRMPDGILSVDHGHPVESVLVYPSGGVFVTAGGNVVKVWDALAGGKLLTQLHHHHKTVTSLGLCSNNRRLFSAGLDRHVKIYDIATYQVVHTLDYPGPLLAAAVSPDDHTIVAGCADGLISIQHRTPSESARREQLSKHKASFKYSLAGKTHLPHKGDQFVGHTRRNKLKKYDKLFRQFKHSKALDAAMDIRMRQMKPDVTLGVIRELIRRGRLKAAIAGRSVQSLTNIVRFIQKNISNPLFMPILIDTANVILDVYGGDAATCCDLLSIMTRLKTTVDAEISYMKLLMLTLGTMDTLFSCSQAPRPPTVTDTLGVPLPDTAT